MLPGECAQGLGLGRVVSRRLCAPTLLGKALIDLCCQRNVCERSGGHDCQLAFMSLHDGRASQGGHPACMPSKAALIYPALASAHLRCCCQVHRGMARLRLQVHVCTGGGDLWPVAQPVLAVELGSGAAGACARGKE